MLRIVFACNNLISCGIMGTIKVEIKYTKIHSLMCNKIFFCATELNSHRTTKLNDIIYLEKAWNAVCSPPDQGLSTTHHVVQSNIVGRLTLKNVIICCRLLVDSR